MRNELAFLRWRTGARATRTQSAVFVRPVRHASSQKLYLSLLLLTSFRRRERPWLCPTTTFQRQANNTHTAIFFQRHDTTMASLPLVRRHQDTADEKPEITKRGIMEALISVRGAAASSASSSGTSAPSALSRTRSFLAALTLASLACSMLRQVFDLFYVETFLTAYELPLSSFSFGTFVYTIIDVINDVGAAYFVDAYALRSSRGAIGRSGCLLALCFLAPFFRGGRRIKESPFLATSHFIISVSSYDTLLTFVSILIEVEPAAGVAAAAAAAARYLDLASGLNMAAVAIQRMQTTRWL